MEKSKKNIYRVLGNVILMIIIFLLLILLRSAIWFLKNFGGVEFSAAVYQLFSPMKGTEKRLLNSYFNECLFPSVYVSFLFCLIYNIIGIVLKKSLPELEHYIGGSLNKLIAAIKSALLCALIVFLVVQIYKKAVIIDIPGYIENISNSSNIYEAEYVKPDETDIVFPENKRNLLLIYMESMETTYASTDSGGGKNENYIPELTQLAEENLYFSNDEDLGGANGYSGTGWTMAGLLATSAGVNYKLPIGGNDAGTYSNFLPGLICIGDILESKGYSNYFMCGSEAVFGGREDFYIQHGNYHIFDYNSAVEDGIISKDYKVFWGMEDEKLYKYAKEKLSRISTNDEPFNFTMLTVDTHHPNGYVCELCDDTYPEQYANVLSCASKQVYQFIDWVKKQEWYENTTIVITGDHKSMKTDFWSDIHYDRKVYNCFINLPENLLISNTTNREFSTMDMFPTILASMGVDIKGDRLGLGTNLFSMEYTLSEKMGADLFSKELAMYSKYYNYNFIMNAGH